MSDDWPSILGRADWIYNLSLGIHIPCCRVMVWSKNDPLGTCGNGPLTGDEIGTGDCGLHS